MIDLFRGRSFLCLCLIFLLSLSSCNKEDSSNSSSVRVGLVTDAAGLGDQSFNDSANEGMIRASKELAVETQVVESSSTTDYGSNLNAFADLGYNLIFSIGFLTKDSLSEAAEIHPDTHFAIIDEVVDKPNVASCTFKEEEGSFLAGVVAGLMTKTGTVGFLGGVEVPLIKKFQAGYEAGVKIANPNVKIIAKYTGDFEDVSKGKDISSILYSQGADIIYHASGKCGLGAIESAKNQKKDCFVIGVDGDQDSLGVIKDNEGRIVKTVVLTSMMKHVDVAVFDVCKMEKEGTFKSGHRVYGLKEGGVSLTEMKFTRDKIPESVIAKIEELEQKIIQGDLIVPTTMEECKKFEVKEK